MSFKRYLKLSKLPFLADDLTMEPPQNNGHHGLCDCVPRRQRRVLLHGRRKPDEAGHDQVDAGRLRHGITGWDPLSNLFKSCRKITQFKGDRGHLYLPQNLPINGSHSKSLLAG